MRSCILVALLMAARPMLSIADEDNSPTQKRVLADTGLPLRETLMAARVARSLLQRGERRDLRRQLRKAIRAKKNASKIEDAVTLIQVLEEIDISEPDALPVLYAPYRLGGFGVMRAITADEAEQLEQNDGQKEPVRELVRPTFEVVSVSDERECLATALYGWKQRHQQTVWLRGWPTKDLKPGTKLDKRGAVVNVTAKKAYTTPAGEKGEAVVIELFDWRAYLQPYLPTPATGKENGRKQ